MNEQPAMIRHPEPVNLPHAWTRRLHPMGIAFYLILGVVLGVAVACRGIYISRHFTQLDDIGVAATLLRNSSPDDVGKTFESKLAISASSSLANPRTRLLYRLRQTSVWPMCNSVFVKSYKYFCIPLEWTYAPVQFFFTAGLVNPGNDYRTILLKGRLPSCIFGIIGVIAIFLLVAGMQGPASPFQALLAASFMAFSLENVVFAMNMGNYALGPLAIVGLVALLIANIRYPSTLPSRALLNGLALAFLFLCHYQIFVFAPAFFIALLLLLLRTHMLWMRSLRSVVITGVIFGIVFLPVFVFRLSDTTTIHWNAGPHGQYMFTLPLTGGILAALAYTFQFGVQHGFMVFASMISFVPETSRLFFPMRFF